MRLHFAWRNWMGFAPQETRKLAAVQAQESDGENELRKELSKNLSDCAVIVASDENRLRTLLSEAASGLTQNFLKINSTVQLQNRTLQEVLTSASSAEQESNITLTDYIKSYANRSCESTNSHLELLMNYSCESVKILDYVTSIQEDSEELGEELQGISRAANRTRLVALNLSAEASRRNDPLLQSISAIMRSLSSDIENINSSLERTIEAIRENVELAAVSAKFVANTDLNETMLEKERMDIFSTDMSALGENLDAKMEFLAEMADEIEGRVLNSITLLQVEDIVRQISELNEKRMDVQQSAISKVGGFIDHDLENRKTIVSELIFANQEFANNADILKSVSVQQASLSEGSVDLF